jgi:hypothetical protein
MMDCGWGTTEWVVLDNIVEWTMNTIQEWWIVDEVHCWLSLYSIFVYCHSISLLIVIIFHFCLLSFDFIVDCHYIPFLFIVILFHCWLSLYSIFVYCHSISLLIVIIFHFCLLSFDFTGSSSIPPNHCHSISPYHCPFYLIIVIPFHLIIVHFT